MKLIEKGLVPHSYKINIFGIRIRFRNKFEMKNNKVIIVSKNGKESVKTPKGLKVKFLGENSLVKIYSPCPKFKNCQITCYDNAFVSIGSSNREISNLTVNIFSKNGKLILGNNLKIRGGGIFIGDKENLSVSIGDNCLFAKTISIRTADYHVVVDKDTKQPLNEPASVNIGNHCWLCDEAVICKGVSLADDTIVGARSYVTKSFDKTNTIIAGIPARVVKDANTTWSEMSYEQYLASIS